MPSPLLLWIRQDLRLTDQPALAAAIDRGGAVLPVFIWAPEEEEPWSPGAASRWWLHHSLARLAADLEARGSRLVVRRAATSGPDAGDKVRGKLGPISHKTKRCFSIDCSR